MSVSTGAPQLQDGSRVAVVGGGPAGSLFAYFLLRLANAIDLDVQVDIFEPRRFTHAGPAGCNHCGGIVSESLVQLLATEGVNLPSTVVQRGIYSYVLHMDVGSVEIESPVLEQRIASVYRGNGPRGGEEMAWESFDGFLQQTAEKEGARVVHKLVTGLGRRDGLPEVTTNDGESAVYDLVTLATGVNSNFRQLVGDEFVHGLPETSRTFICEYKAGEEHIQEILGDSMHVFLLDLPRLEFAALIPKGDYVTMAMLGDEIDRDLIGDFLDTAEVRRAFPVETVPGVCTCAPLINMKGPDRPYGDRVVMIGDMGVTRLYKDGIGAAFRTSKAAAETAIIHGISEEDFAAHYRPACRKIAVDNRFGHVIFAFMMIFRKSRYARRIVLAMTSREQARPAGRHMSGILWNMFTGSAPYREVFFRAFHPGFIFGFLRSALVALVPTRRKRRNHGTA
jgi:flavin-dependent dehydrogenase